FYQLQLSFRQLIGQHPALFLRVQDAVAPAIQDMHRQLQVLVAFLQPWQYWLKCHQIPGGGDMVAGTHGLGATATQGKVRRYGLRTEGRLHDPFTLARGQRQHQGAGKQPAQPVPADPQAGEDTGWPAGRQAAEGGDQRWRAESVRVPLCSIARPRDIYARTYTFT